MSTKYKVKPKDKTREHSQTVTAIWSSVIAVAIVSTWALALMHNHRTMEMLWPLALGPAASTIPYWLVTRHYWMRANKTRIDQGKEPKKKGKPHWSWVGLCLVVSALYLAAMLVVSALPITDSLWLWTHHLGWFFGLLLYTVLWAAYWSVNYYLVRGRPRYGRMVIAFLLSMIGMILLDSARYYFWLHA